MKALVLGGAGYMGSEIAYQLIKRSNATLTVADRNRKKLQKITEELGSRVNVQHTDVEDFENLVSLMKDVDVVISSVGPFHKYGVKVLKAAIQANTNYIDINDDYDATQEQLALDKEAKEAGMAAIVGMGASPGVTNLLAKHAADGLDQVDDISLFWSESCINPTGSAALDHWFHIISGDIPIFKDKESIFVPGFSGCEVVEFIPPIGRLEVFYTGHPEPVTLPKYIKGLKNASIKGTLYPPKIMNLYKSLLEVGCGSQKEFILKEDFSMPLRELAIKLIRAMPHFSPKYFQDITTEATETYQHVALGFKVEVVGEKTGEKTRLIYDFTANNTTECTATAAVLAAIMISNGEVKGSGVFAPEGVIDPALFLRKFGAETKIYKKEIKEKVSTLSHV